MKRLTRNLTLGLVLALVPMATLAATPRATTTPTPTPTPALASNLPTPTPKPATLAKGAQAAHLSALKSRGGVEISRRITSLQTSLTAVKAATKLSEADKTTLTAQIQAEINGLQTLASKLAGESTLAGARTDVQSIFDDFRVYALMLPKARLVAASDRLSLVTDELNEIANHLHTKINQAKAAGRDTTTAQATVEDLQAKLMAAKAKTDGLAAKIIALTPTDYNANRTLLAGYRDTVVLARADLKAARSDVDTVIRALGGKTTTTPTPSVSPTP